jgi:hypothetical protein
MSPYTDKIKEYAMQTIFIVITILGITTSLALAGEGSEIMGSSLFVILFFGFGALIVIFQLIPSLVLFCSMIKGLFGKEEERRERIITPTPELGLTMADGGRQVMEEDKINLPITDETRKKSD